jgi:hypothetical protein
MRIEHEIALINLLADGQDEPAEGPPSSCPPAEMYLALFETHGALDPALGAHLTSHAAQCGQCHELFLRLQGFSQTANASFDPSLSEEDEERLKQTGVQVTQWARRAARRGSAFERLRRWLPEAFDLLSLHRFLSSGRALPAFGLAAVLLLAVVMIVEWQKQGGRYGDFAHGSTGGSSGASPSDAVKGPLNSKPSQSSAGKSTAAWSQNPSENEKEVSPPQPFNSQQDITLPAGSTVLLRVTSALNEDEETQTITGDFSLDGKPDLKVAFTAHRTVGSRELSLTVSAISVLGGRPIDVAPISTKATLEDQDAEISEGATLSAVTQSEIRLPIANH